MIKISDKISDLALNLRKEWNISQYSPIDIFSLTQEKINNLTILWFPAIYQLSGCCSKENNISIILLNSLHSKAKQNFTLAHELYHLLYNDGYFFMCNENQKDKNEINANEFASQFLMPDIALKNYMVTNNISKWSISDLIRCEQYYYISHDLLLYRLLKIDLISNSDFESFNIDINDNVRKLGFSTDLYDKNPENYENYAIGDIIAKNEEALNKGIISKGLYKEILMFINRMDIIN